MLVGGGAEQGGDFCFEEAEVDGELAAMMGEMTEDRVGNHDAAGILGDGVAAHFESPRLG